MTQGRTVVVTGGSGGIGSAIVRVLSQEGYAVAALDERAPDRPPEGVTHHGVDLSDRTSLMTTLDVVLELAGEIGGFVHAAGIFEDRHLEETTEKDWDRTIEVNLTAAFLCIQRIVPQMRPGSGIVLIGSVHGVATRAPSIAYASSKSAIAGFARSLALELGPKGVRVNTVVPGAIRTRMLVAGLASTLAGDAPDPDALMDGIVARQAIRRLGEPDDVAQAVSFLLDDERAGFITGSTVVVDGGALVRLGTE